jgi:peptide/nickel transport system permease protein
MTTAESTRTSAILRRLRGGVEIITRRLRRNPLTLLGAVIVCVLGLLAIVGPVVTPYDPAAQNLPNRLQAPSLAHPLGTDRFGRDLLTRIVYGARFSLGIALAVTAIRVVVGTAVGLVSGYAGGWVDEALMRLVDIQLAFPGLVLALVIAGILGPSLQNLLIALAVVGWSTYARVVRGSVLSIKERRYVDAARLVGTPRHRLFRRHLLPNVISPVVVIATLNLGTVVLATAGLSFIGLGAQPPTPEWGTMLAGGRQHMRQAWWIVNAPGAAIMLTVLGFNLLGDGLRDVLDPRQQTRIEEV